jgi:hypothetical protein
MYDYSRGVYRRSFLLLLFLAGSVVEKWRSLRHPVP